MTSKTSISKQKLSINIDSVAALIKRTQLDSGEIPWSKTDKTDPWDHVEAIMGLSVGGYFDEARRGFEWMRQNQLENGSWYSSYQKGIPDDKTLDSNMSSYIAVGLFHHFLITGDKAFLKKMWPTLRGGIEYALGLQIPSGEIYWARSPDGEIDPMSLLTGSSSVFMSLKCAIVIAGLLEIPVPGWRASLAKLGDAIKNRRHRFNVAKSRFSMDWFYPILCGVITGAEAQKRIDTYWKKFVVDGLGVRCVSDEPWVTIAETSEFVLSLSAMGNFQLASIIFSWIQDKCYEDGSCWCGFTFPDMIIWPDDKVTWTNAVVLMAADALYNLTPASQLFSHKFWVESGYSRFL